MIIGNIGIGCFHISTISSPRSPFPVSPYFAKLFTMKFSMGKSVLPFAAALIAALAGCMTPERAMRETDEAGTRLAAEAMAAVSGATNEFAITRPAERLRLRLLAEPDLDADTRAALTPTNTPALPSTNTPAPASLTLSLADALRIGAENDNGYQSKKESIFLAALDLDLARHQFENTFAGILSGGADGTRTSSGGESTRETSLSASAKPSVSRKFKNGANAMASFGVDIIKLLSGGHGRTLGLTGDFSATVPLLRGAGRLVATEGLTQAERDLIYAVYDFEGYRQSYAVEVASAYYGLLKTEQNLIALRENGERLSANYDRAKMLYDAGRLSQVELDQTRQDLLSTGDKIVSAEKSRQSALDAFAITLGLPVGVPLALDMGELDALSADMAAPQVEETSAVALALTNRFGLVVSRMKIDDAERAVAIARDGLRASLGLKVDAGWNSSKPSGGGRTEKNSAAAMLTSDLPWERTSERNAYRAAVIALDAGRRALEAEEDSTRQIIRDDIRALNSAWSSFEIQREALEVAQRRVRSTTLFQQAGRSSTRDLLESEAALLSARNAVVAAVVDYRMAGLRLERDMSALRISESGLIESSPEP